MCNDHRTGNRKINSVTIGSNKSEKSSVLPEMDSPLFATPVARQGPTSRLLRRRSEKVAQASNLSAIQAPDRNFSFAVPVTPRGRNYGGAMTTFNVGTDETVAWDATRWVLRC